MKNIIILTSAEIFFILLGWMAWLFNPSATFAIAVGWGVAIGTSVPYLIHRITEAVFFERHKKEILADAAKALSIKLGREVKPEDFENIKHGPL